MPFRITPRPLLEGDPTGAPTFVLKQETVFTMEQIKLSKHAKRVFRLLDKGVGHRPADMNPREYNLGAIELEALGFAKCYRNTGSDDVVMAHLLKRGRLYIAGNPSLRNPINWTIIGAIAACITAAAAIAALFIACSKL